MQTLSLVHFKAAVLGLPRIDRVLGDSALSGYVLGRAACLHLLQRCDDLRLRVPALAHTLSSIPNHTSVCPDLGEQVITTKYRFEQFRPDLCMKIDPAKRNYLLLGDSHSTALWYGLTKLMPNANILQASVSGCNPTLRCFFTQPQ